jgi:flagellar assembly protein FliH
MTNSSERADAAAFSASLPGTDAGNAHHARFIPREELEAFAAWRPHAFDDVPPHDSGVRSPRDDAQRAAKEQAALQGVRQAGYQDGYRDGLVALESFKQAFATQMSAQLGGLVAAFDAEFARLEADIAQCVASSAVALARQVVRSELATRPELVAGVAAQAIEAVLLSAKHIRVHVNPVDLPLVQQGAADALTTRGSRLLADATISRGGCRVESDLGRIDASIEARWSQAAATMGQALPLHGDAPEPSSDRAGPTADPA